MALDLKARHGLNEAGELTPITVIVENLPLMPPTLFAMVGAADWIGYLDTVFRERDPDHWQWRASAHERDICRPDGVRVAMRCSTLIHFFGFREGNYAHGKRVYHKIIDPISMYGHSLDEVYPDGDDTPINRLLKWAVCIRDFCAENNVEVRPTIGGVSSQFLTDRRFYPHKRRKVPAKINERSRENLPGNFYQLNASTDPGKEFTAVYLDQHRAHHYHAERIRFPDANSLYAHGRFLDLAEPVSDHIRDGFMGLLCVDVLPPRRNPAYSWISGNERVFLYTNELQHVLDMGYTITGVRAAWGSFTQDEGMNKFANWADSQLTAYGSPPWLKPLLLSTYGTLAAKPNFRESVFRICKGGSTVKLHTGRHNLVGSQVRHTNMKLEPGIANVLHRGMIEAATRSESIGLAEYLTYKGFTVLSIYADAVIVQADEVAALVELPDPWRSKGTLNHLQFINQQAFMSGEMTKLPGVTKELRAYRAENTGPAPRLVPYVEALSGATVFKPIGQ